MAELKGDTHFVIKKQDIIDYLTCAECKTLLSLMFKINFNRKNEGKSINSYAICNMDEPYYDEVLGVILKGEDAKTRNADAGTSTLS